MCRHCLVAGNRISSDIKEEPHMPFGQGNLAIAIHNICKWQVESRDNRFVEAVETNIQLETLKPGTKSV